MRALHVATLVTPDGAYGGPTRVALNQARSLMDLGTDVILTAGTRGYSSPPRQIDGVRTELFPVRQVVPRTGFAGLQSRGLQDWLRRNLATFDVVHIHLARDLVTLPAAWLALRERKPVVLQTHGMIDPSDRWLARLLDTAVTRRTLRESSEILYLTDTERTNLLAVEPTLTKLIHLTNGVPPSDVRANPDSREVLFLARLHPRKRPKQFLDAAVALSGEFPDWKFTILGPDEGEGPALRSRIPAKCANRIHLADAIPPESVLGRLGEAAIYVLPAEDEPYPMGVLEAMSVGLPVIVSDTCGLASAVRETGAGLVTNGTTADLQACMRRVMLDSDLRRSMGASSLAACERFEIASVAKVLDGVYRTVHLQASEGGRGNT